MLDEKTIPRSVALGTHVLRHTYATHRLQEGIPPTNVAAAIGDSVPTLLAYYAHAMPDENQDRLRVDLDAVVGNSGHPMGTLAPDRPKPQEP